MAKISLKLKDFSALNIPKNKIAKVVSDFNKSETRSIGNEIVKEMKDLISKGISPIQSVGRFKAYKNPARYPKRAQKDFPSKKERPVNLKLSGAFLDSLKVTSASGAKFTIGFDNKLSEDKESGHREGVFGQPKRPIIPQSNETFAVSIKQIIVSEIVKRLNALLKT